MTPGRRIAMIAVSVLLTAPMFAQNSKPSRAQSVVRIYFPADVRSEGASLTFGLHHPTGGFAKTFGMKMPAGESHFEIPTITADGITVDRFKALVWAPGCKMQEFDDMVLPVDTELQFKCYRQNTLKFSGRVKSGGPGVLSVEYMAMGTCFWMDECSEGCLIHCGGPQITDIAQADVAADGTFNLELPDFTTDSFVSDDASAGFEFRFNRFTLLKPESAFLRSVDDHLLKVMASYPTEVSFLSLEWSHADLTSPYHSSTRVMRVSPAFSFQVRAGAASGAGAETFKL